MKKIIKLTNSVKYGIDFEFLADLSRAVGKPIFKIDNELDHLADSASYATDILSPIRRRMKSPVGEDGVVILQRAIDELEMTKQRIILSRKLQKDYAFWKDNPDYCADADDDEEKPKAKLVGHIDLTKDKDKGESDASFSLAT